MIEKLRACVRQPTENVPEFTACFVTLWCEIADRGGITEVEAMSRYIIRLPRDWGLWAARAAVDFSDRDRTTFAERVYFSRLFTYVLRVWADGRGIVPRLTPAIDGDVDYVMLRVSFTPILATERTIEVDRSAPSVPEPPLTRARPHDDEAGPSKTQLEPTMDEDPEEDPEEEPIEKHLGY